MRDAYLCGVRATGGKQLECGAGQSLDDEKYLCILESIEPVLSFICVVSGREGDKYKCVRRDVGQLQNVERGERRRHKVQAHLGGVSTGDLEGP